MTKSPPQTKSCWPDAELSDEIRDTHCNKDDTGWQHALEETCWYLQMVCCKAICWNGWSTAAVITVYMVSLYKSVHFRRVRVWSFVVVFFCICMNILSFLWSFGVFLGVLGIFPGLSSFHQKRSDVTLIHLGDLKNPRLRRQRSIFWPRFVFMRQLKNLTKAYLCPVFAAFVQYASSGWQKFTIKQESLVRGA